MYPPFTLLYVQFFLINTLILLFHNFVQYNEIKAYTTLLIFFTPNVARFKQFLFQYTSKKAEMRNSIVNALAYLEMLLFHKLVYKYIKKSIFVK